jgi:hypothetical protein
VIYGAHSPGSAAAFQERLPHVLDGVWEFLAAQRGVLRVVCVAALRDLKGPEAAVYAAGTIAKHKHCEVTNPL